MLTCEHCGERVYSLGCVNCREADYLEAEFAEELADMRAADEQRRVAEARAEQDGEQDGERR